MDFLTSATYTPKGNCKQFGRIIQIQQSFMKSAHKNQDKNFKRSVQCVPKRLPI